MSLPASEHRIKVDDGEIVAIETGRGAPLVLLHGWPLDHRMFDYQVRELSERFRCIAIDRRGFGHSTAPPDMRCELHDIDALIEQLDLGPVHLLGVSQGARIALRYAVTRPERLRSLVLQGAVIDGFEVDESAGERIPVQRYAVLAKAGQLEFVVEHWLGHPMMTLPEDKPAEQQLVRTIIDDYKGSDLIAFDPSLYGFEEDVAGKLAATALPILVLTGSHETAARRAHEDEICRLAPNSRRVEFRDSGHLSNLTEPLSYNRVLSEFLSSIDSVAA